jgi:hypothetical protein
MTATPDVFVSKCANAFFPDAEMSEAARGAFIFGGDSSVDWLRRRMGGLWVGGRVTLTSGALSFGPNALNAAAHDGDVIWTIPLSAVAEVKDRFGWLTRIVDVRTDNGETVTFRCFGAPAFAEQIRQAVRIARF